MAARKYASAESTGTSSTTSTSDQTKVTLTFTPDANSTYAYIWSCQAGGATNFDVRVKLKNNAGTVLCNGNHQNNDANDFIPYSGFAIETFGSSPTSQSITLTYSSEGTITASIKNARIVAIKLTSADVYSENTGTSTTSSTSVFTAATTATFTPASAGFYAVLGYCEQNSGSNGGAGRYRVTINDALSYNSAELVSLVTDFIPNMSVSYSTSLSGSCNIKYEFNSYGGNTVSCRNAKILALRMDEFDYSNIGINNSNNTTTTSTSYATAETTGALDLQKYNYMILGCAHYYTTSASIQAHFRWQTDGVTWAESDITNTTLGSGSGRAVSRNTGVYVRTSSIGQSTTNVQYRRDGATTTGNYNTTLLYLALEPATGTKGRKYHSAESTTTSTSTSTADTNKVTLTFTPDANSTYAYIWNCEVGNGSTAYDTRVNLKNNAGTAVCSMNIEPQDTTDIFAVSGFDIEAFGASPTSQSITLNFSTENAGGTASIRNARLIAIKLSSADQYVENTADATTTSTTLQTATTLTFTPASAGNYLILGQCELRTTSSGTIVNTQITHNSVAYSASANRPNDQTNYISNLLQASVGNLAASSQSITMQYSSNINGNTVNCRNAKLLALRLDEFSFATIKTDNTRTTTTSTSYTTKTSFAPIVLPSNLNCLVIGTATIDGNSTTLSNQYRFITSASPSPVTWLESVQESVNGSTHASRIGGLYLHSSGTTSYINLDYLSETASTTTGADEVTISVLQLDADQLYWVGGSGTWDGSTTTNWSGTSGGTGGVGAPKSGTKVVFDSGSDSSAPFTVTINAGAVCNDLTASGLDQTMTWSGSGAMSVYGNFSVPATNFTQSYTGTITFAGTSTETITTNGKSFTAFTFDGVGGTWTLQDAATITGAATLTNGTLALGSYTFTCDNFASSNSNTRTINFGTGKIVISSASTATVWNTGTVTNLTVSGTPLVELTGGGATTKTISAGALSEANSISFSLLNTAGTVSFTASNTVRNLIIANNSITISNIAITIYGNLTINGTTPTLTAGANAWTFAATSGTKTITTNGKTLDFPLTFNGVGGTWQLTGALTVGTSTSRAVTMSNGTFDLMGYDFTLYGTWNQTAGGIRLQNTGGTTNRIILTLDTNATVFDGNVGSGNTTDGNITVRVLGSNAATTRRYDSARGVGDRTASYINWEIAATAGTINFGAAADGQTFGDLTIENNSITFNFNGPMVLGGDFIVSGTNPTVNFNANIMYFSGTTGTQVINLNGNNSNTMDCPVQFNFYGTGTVQLAHNLNIGVATSRTVTFIQGTLDLNEYNLTIYGLFTSSRSDTRTIDFGSASKIILTLSGTTVWNTSTATNLSVVGTDPLVQLTATGGTATISMNNTGVTESNVFNVQLSSATTTTVTLTGSVRNLTIDNFDITLNNSARTIYGNFTISGTTPTMAAGASVTTFAATSGIKTITTNGEVIDFPLTFSGIGGTWQLQDALSVGTSTVRTVTLTSGTLDLNGFTFTIFGQFSSSNSNARTIAFGTTGKIVLSATGATTTTLCTMTTETNLTVTGTNPLFQVTGSGVGPLTVTSTSSLINLQLSPVAAATIAVTGNIKDFTIDNSSNITLSNGTRSIYGDLTIGGTSPTLTAGALVTTFAATSGTHTITTNGEVIDFPITFNGVGGTWQLLSNMSVGTSTARAVTLTSGTIDLNEYNMTIFGSFESGGSSAKVIDFGSVSKIVLTLNVTASALSLQTATNLSYLGSNPLFEFNGSGGAVTVTLSGSNAIEAAAPNLRINPASTVTTSVTHSFTNLTVENISGSTVNISTAARLYGNLVIAGTNPIFNNGTLTFSKTSGTQTITSNGKIIEFRMTIDGTGTVVQLLDALTAVALSNNLTLTNGTLDLNEYTMTIGQFTSSNSNVREIDFGTSGKLVLSGLTSAAAVVNCATVTNFTLTGNPSIEIAGSSSSARQYLFGSTVGNSIESNAPDLTVTATGAGAVELFSSKFRNLTYNTSDTNGNITSGTPYCYGNLTSTNNGRIIGAGTITFAATSGTKTISLNAPAAGHQFNITINGIGGTFQAASNLDIIGSSTSSGNFTLTNGTFEAGSYNITARLFDSNNSNIRTLNLGSGTWTFTGTGAIWNTTTTTNLTFIKGTANIVSTHASTTLVEFRGGGLTYNNLTTTSTLNRVDIYGNNTFNTLTIAAGGALRFEAGSTNTFSTFSFGNNSGDNAALDTTTAGVAATLVYAGSAKVRTNYVTVRDITGSPVDTWYMGPNSTNTSNNTNLYFYNPPLYWIGGSGTWNNSSTTNWSFFSGGSSAGYYPDQYTDVYFDAGSDSGSAFDILTGTGVTVNCRNFTASGLDRAMTLTIYGSGAIINVYGDFYIPSTNFSFTGIETISGKLVFASTSTGKTITTNGTSLLEVEFNGVGGGWTLQDNYTATLYTILTAGTITLNDKTLTTPSFTFTGSTARSIAFGTSGKIVLTGSVGQPSNREWDGSTLTNFTVSGSRRVEYTDTPGIAFFHGDTSGATETNSVDLYITSSTTGVHNIQGYVRTLDFTGSTTAWDARTITVYGNLIISSGMSISHISGTTLTFAGTVANGQTYQYITTNGKNVNWSNITFSGTAQYTLQDQFTCGTSGNGCSITLTTGTIVMGNYNIVQTAGTFSGGGTGVRGITSTGGVWKNTYIISSTTNVWNTSVATNLTITDLTVELYGSGSTNTRQISPGSTGLTQSNSTSFVIDLTDGTFTITSGNGVKNITFKDKAYTFSSITENLTVYGNFIFEGSSNVTFTGGSSGTLTFAGTGTQTITTNGETIDKPVTFSGTGSYSLGSAVTVGSTRLTTYTSGNLVLNGYTFTVGTFTASGTASRTINHGTNGQITVVGSGASAFLADGSNITYSGLGTINMTSASAKTFTANGNIFSTLNQAGAGTLTVRSRSVVGGSKTATFYSIKNTAYNATISFNRNSTFILTNKFEISGANTANPIIVDSTADVVSDPIEGGWYAKIVVANTTPQNVRHIKINNYTVAAVPNNSVIAGNVQSSVYVRNSPKEAIGATVLFYNDDATDLSGFGSQTSNGWNFVREQGFLTFF